MRTLEMKRCQEPISCRVAGIWSIWSRWSVSFVWFDERERQDSPRAPARLPLNRPSPHPTLPITSGVMDTPPTLQ